MRRTTGKLSSLPAWLAQPCLLEPRLRFITQALLAEQSERKFLHQELLMENIVSVTAWGQTLKLACKNSTGSVQLSEVIKGERNPFPPLSPPRFRGPRFWRILSTSAIFWGVHRSRQYELQLRLSSWLKNSYACRSTVLCFFSPKFSEIPIRQEKIRDWRYRGDMLRK